MDQLFKERDKESTEQQNFYKLLGCDKTSSVEQIQTEFKRHALAYHPDKNDSAEARNFSIFSFIRLKFVCKIIQFGIINKIKN